MQCELEIQNEKLTLLPEKAIYWKDQNALLIADLHLGKVTHFRKNGIGIPIGPEYENWEKLCSLITEYNPKVIYLLGDLFHSKYNNQWTNFLEIMETYNSIDWVLIKGNHDILPEEAYQHEVLKVMEGELSIPPFTLTHEPPSDMKDDQFILCGHIHPAIRMVGAGLQSMRVPCFYFNGHFGILPAFGAFTGMHTIKPTEGDKVFVIAEDMVIDMCDKVG